MTSRPSPGALPLLVAVVVMLVSAESAATDTTFLPPPGAKALTDRASHRTFDQLGDITLPFRRLDPISDEEASIPDTILTRRMHAHALLERVLREQRFLESLDALSEIDLPVGLARSGGATDYMILIDRIEFTREGAMMDVYVSLALPQVGSQIAFHGRVPLAAKGGIAGNARIYLIGDHRLRLNENVLITLRGTNRSYVEFDCSGFLGVNLDGEMSFSTDVIVPEDDNGKPLNERVTVAFTTYTQTLHDILLKVSLPPFQVRGLDGFGFYISEAYLDWSDLSNPPGIVFPDAYRSSVVDAGLEDLWHGLYLSEAEVRLPPAFASRSGNSRIAAGLQQAILDEQGVTGDVFVANLLPDGDMRGWKYTVDKFTLSLAANRISAFSLEGSLSLPVVKDKNGAAAAFLYLAHRDAQGQYVFSVDVEGSLRLDLWAAELELHKGSRVIVTEHENTFYPSAHLNGELAIALGSKGPKARLTGIRFENMVISSEAPYFRPGSFGFGRPGERSTLAKYPLVFDNIALRSEDVRVGIAFDVLVNIGGKPEEGAFAGKGQLVVWGKQEDLPIRDEHGNAIAIDRTSWVFDRVELSSLRIDVRKPKIIELAGEVRFFDDNDVYGEGFKGSLKGKIQSIAVQAEALFGRTDSFRYWYADALVELDQGVPLVPGCSFGVWLWRGVLFQDETNGQRSIHDAGSLTVGHHLYPRRANRGNSCHRPYRHPETTSHERRRRT